MNRLVHLREFQTILATYQVKPAHRQLLQQVPFVFLVAPSAAGRNTIIRQLVKTGEYYFLVSDTTRLPRVNDGRLEQNGDVYWFRSEAEFLADLRAGQFVEAAIIHQQQVSGINIREFQRAHTQAKIALTEIETHGAQTFMRLKPDSLAIFMLPPSFEEWQHRLAKRGYMPPAELKRRLASAEAELAAALQCPYYHFVINHSPAQTIAQIQHLVHTRTSQANQQVEARRLAEQLHHATQALLNHL